jgi:hypothetical protein
VQLILNCVPVSTETVITYTVRTVLSCTLVKNTFFMVYSLRHFVSLNDELLMNLEVVKA